jgi:hypothetical protein
MNFQSVRGWLTLIFNRYQSKKIKCQLGCIDGTHVPIQAPVDDEPSFVNRKGFHSINVQGICDHNSKYMIKNVLLS